MENLERQLERLEKVSNSKILEIEKKLADTANLSNQSIDKIKKLEVYFDRSYFKEKHSVVLDQHEVFYF